MTMVFILVALVVVPVAAAFLFTAWTARKVEALLPPQGRFVDVAGTRLHVHDCGTPAVAGAPGRDPAILLIHGLGGQAGHYTYGIAGLLAGRRVVVVDRPGNGHSAMPAAAADLSPASPADLAAQAAVLAALIERLGLHRPVVVGHSLGGAVALALALDHPHHVGGLALLAPLTHMQDAAPPVFKSLTIASPRLRKVFAWTFAIPASIRNSRAALDQVFGPEPVPQDYALRGGGLLGLRPRTFLAASADLQALPARLPLQQARYAGLDVPLRILYGRDDRILDWRHHGRALADKVAGARLDLVDGGHMLPITNPRACAATIEAVLADIGTAATARAAGAARG